MAQSDSSSYTPELAKHPTIKDVGLTGFIQWMQSDPVMSKVYARAKNQIDAVVRVHNAGMSGLGDLTDLLQPVNVDPSLTASIPDYNTAASSTPTSSWTDSLSSIVSAAGQAVLTGEQLITANKVTNTQLARAQAGLAPLNLSAYGISTTPGVNVGLSSSTQSMVMYLGIGLLGVILLPKLLKR
jgi:hypothetical protein